jgi:hypothetical protein
LLLPHSLPAAIAAVALTSITTHTDGEKRVACGVKAPPQAKALGSSICWYDTGHSQPQYARDDRTDDCAVGAMMSLAPGVKFKKLRFLMIDDTSIKSLVAWTTIISPYLFVSRVPTSFL